MIAMVNHLPGHATVDADVLASDETSLFGTEEKYHVGNVERIADTACRLLVGIGTLIHLIVRIYPSWRDGINTSLACKTDGKCMCECCNTALRSRVAFCLRLTHAVARR